MKKIILLLLAFTVTNFASAEIIIDSLPDVEYRNPDGTTFVPDVTGYPKITQMERLTFGQSYEKEPIELRLSRLETKLYKRDYSSSSLSERTAMISSSLDNMSVTKRDKNELSSMERKMFNQAYPQDDTQNRVARLERHILGASQSGDLASRINTLKTASSSLQSQNNMNNMAQQNQYNPYQPQNGIKNAFKNALSGLGQGTMTGFSPPVNYNSNYYPQYQQAYAPNMGFNGLYQGNYTNMPNSNFQTYTPYNQAKKQGFYYPAPQRNTYFQDVFGDSGGNEMYYQDGQYKKDMRTSGGGCAVTIID